MDSQKLVITPKKYKGDTTIISGRIPSELAEKIDAIADETNRNRNEVLQILLAYAVDHAEVKKEEEEQK